MSLSVVNATTSFALSVSVVSSNTTLFAKPGGDTVVMPASLGNDPAKFSFAAYKSADAAVAYGNNGSVTCDTFCRSGTHFGAQGPAAGWGGARGSGYAAADGTCTMCVRDENSKWDSASLESFDPAKISSAMLFTVPPFASWTVGSDGFKYAVPNPSPTNLVLQTDLYNDATVNKRITVLQVPVLLVNATIDTMYVRGQPINKTSVSMQELDAGLAISFSDGTSSITLQTTGVPLTNSYAAALVATGSTPAMFQPGGAAGLKVMTVYEVSEGTDGTPTITLVLQSSIRGWYQITNNLPLGLSAALSASASCFRATSTSTTLTQTATLAPSQSVYVMSNFLYQANIVIDSWVYNFNSLATDYLSPQVDSKYTLGEYARHENRILATNDAKGGFVLTMATKTITNTTEVPMYVTMNVGGKYPGDGTAYVGGSTMASNNGVSAAYVDVGKSLTIAAADAPFVAMQLAFISRFADSGARPVPAYVPPADKSYSIQSLTLTLGKLGYPGNTVDYKILNCTYGALPYYGNTSLFGKNRSLAAPGWTAPSSVNVGRQSFQWSNFPGQTTQAAASIGVPNVECIADVFFTQTDTIVFTLVNSTNGAVLGCASFPPADNSNPAVGAALKPSNSGSGSQFMVTSAKPLKSYVSTMRLKIAATVPGAGNYLMLTCSASIVQAVAVFLPQDYANVPKYAVAGML